jgi:hypothetical protein
MHAGVSLIPRYGRTTNLASLLAESCILPVLFHRKGEWRAIARLVWSDPATYPGGLEDAHVVNVDS